VAPNGILTQINNGQGNSLTNPTIDIVNLSPLQNYTVRIFCANAAGFERTGFTFQFSTPIPAPNATLIFFNQTCASIEWTPAEYAQWYYIQYTDPSLVLVNAQLNATSIFLDDLTPSTAYTVTIFSGMGSSHEPHGDSITFTTLSDVGNNQGTPPPGSGGLGVGGIIGVVIAAILGAILLVVLIFGLFVYRQRRNTKQLKEIVAQEMSIREDISMKKDETMRSRRSSKSRTSVADATLLNTTMEISVPGFLLLDGNSQYRIEGPLGSGGAATVFRGVLLDSDLIAQHNTNYVAVKKITSNPKLSEEQNKDRFLQEISIMWSCTFHQNVIKLIGYSIEPELCIIARLYEIDLFTLIHHPNETISPLLALKLVCDIAGAMAYCQEVGIVHRDLKSSNILLEQVPVNEKESMLKAILCDFGLARVTNSASTLDNLKIQEIGGFSPRYAAPEVLANSALQMSSDPETDKKSDVYSYAIIIWELLTRRVPWEGLNREQIEANVRNGIRPPMPANDGNDQAKMILIDLMTACWQDAPEARPSFTQVYSKLSSLL